MAMIAVHDRFMTNGFALPAPCVLLITKWTCNENLTLVLYEVVIEISRTLQCPHLHMQIADTKMNQPTDLWSVGNYSYDMASSVSRQYESNTGL